MKSKFILAVLSISFMVVAQEYNIYSMQKIIEISNGVDAGEIDAWEDVGDENPTGMIFDRRGFLFFSDTDRGIIIVLNDTLDFVRSIDNSYSYAGIDYTDGFLFQSYRQFRQYISWDNHNLSIKMDLRGRLGERNSSVFYQMHSFFYDGEGNIYCIPDPGPDYATFDDDRATVYQNEEVVALFEPDSGVDMKGLTIDEDYNLFDFQGNLVVRDLGRFYDYWSRIEDLDERNLTDTPAEEIYTYPSQFMGRDANNNYYWSNYSAVIVSNNRGQILDLFLPNDTSKSETRPAVHPNGDIYFLDYDDEWVYIRRPE
jgi:hypothetical protein